MKGQVMSATEILRILRGSNFFTVIESTELTHAESIECLEKFPKDKNYNVLIEPAYYGVHLLIWE